MSGYPIGVYEKSLYMRQIGEMLDDAARIGFDLFELSVDESKMRRERLVSDKSFRDRLSRQSRDAGVPIYSMCFSAHRRFPMGSSDKEIEKKSMKMMEQALNLAEDLGIRVVQIAGYDVFYEEHTEDTARRFQENLVVSVEKAARKGIMLSVETVETHITNIEKAMKLVTEIQSPWLSIYPDVANLYTMGFSPNEEILKGAGKITTVHMREAPDENYIPFGEGILDFRKIFQALKIIKFHGPLVVELWNETNPEYRNILKQAVDFLREMMEENGNV